MFAEDLDGLGHSALELSGAFEQMDEFAMVEALEQHAGDFARLRRVASSLSIEQEFNLGIKKLTEHLFTVLFAKISQRGMSLVRGRTTVGTARGRTSVGRVGHHGLVEHVAALLAALLLLLERRELITERDSFRAVWISRVT